MSQPRYVEMEIHGSKDEILGFIEGLRMASETEYVWYCRDGSFEHATLMDSIRERIGLETHVVMPQALADTVQSYLERSPLLRSSVEWVKRIRRLKLPFEYRCYSQEVGVKLREVIEEHLPEGVKLEEYEVHEDVDDGAKGVELYSPAHDYILVGKGLYKGNVPGIFKVAERLVDQDFIKPGKIHFEFLE